MSGYLTLLELSKGKLHAYRDEARLTDLPDKLRPEHLSDDRTDVEKNRRKKGIQNATDKLQKIHKDTAKVAKLARKDKPPKPKKPDSRQKTNEEINMSLNEMKYGATHEFRGLTEFMDKHATKILNKHHIQIHSIETLPEEKSTIFHVSGSNELLQKAAAAFWDVVQDSSPAFKPIAYKPSKFQGMDKKYMQEETDRETGVEETAVDSRDMFSAIIDEDENTDEMFEGLMGSRVDAVLDAMKQEMAAGMFAEPEEEEVEVAAEDFTAALEELGVEYESLEEAKLSGEGRKISTSDANAHKAQDAEHRGDFAGAKVFWKRSGLNRIGTKGGTMANLKLQIRGKNVQNEDVQSDWDIELTEEQYAVLEASFWKPEKSGFSKKGFERPKSASAMKMSRFKEYDKDAHEKSKSVKVSDQIEKGGK